MLRLITSRLGRVGQETGSRILPVAQRRTISYYDSTFEGPPETYTGVEKSYAEWKWVEKLMPNKYVPKPPSDPSVQLASGWSPPNPPKDSQYIIRRNKNHMIPVYCLIKNRGQWREIRIRRVEGNIWELEKEIGEYLKKLYPQKTIFTYTQECARFVGIKGDYLDEVKDWVKAKGF